MNNTVLRLRLLICNPKGLGPKKIPGRTSAETIMTSYDRFDARLCSYECKSVKQWEEKAREFAQSNNLNQFFVHAMLVDDRTGTRHELKPGALFVALPEEDALPATPDLPAETSAGTDSADGGKPLGDEKALGETVPTAETEPADACDGIGSPQQALQEPPPVETPAEPAEPEPDEAPEPEPAKPKTAKSTPQAKKKR